MSELTIDNTKAITHAVIPVEPGKVVLIEGPNGSGKTTALEAIRAAADRKRGSLEPKDGHGRTGGKLTIPGCTLKVGSRISARGKPAETWVIVEDGSGLASFIEPGVKSPEAADKKRLESLMQMMGVKADADMVGRVIGDDLLSELQKELPGVTELPLVDAVGKVKRWLDEKARAAEVEYQAAQKSLDALGSPPADPDDVLDYDEAVDALAAAEKHRDDLASRKKAAADAETALKGQEWPDLEKLEVAVENDENAVRVASDEVKRLKRELEEAEAARDKLESSLAVSQSRLSDGRATHESLTALQEKIRDTVTDEEMDDAGKAALAARRDLQVASDTKGVLRQIEEHRQKSQQLHDEIERLAPESERLRDTGRSLSSLLAEPVATLDDLSINEDMRLCVKHARGEIPFSELSPGEKAGVAIRVLCSVKKWEDDCVPMVTVPQEVYEGMDAENRAMLPKLAEEHGLCIFVAQASQTLGAELSASVLE